MANHGSKFVSVNLNKSYGQQHQPSYHAHYPHFNGGGSSYGPAGGGRGRPGSGGAGGMLVLSRARGVTPKVFPKLSVPPPLNLPSLRKEHEKFDILGGGGPGAGSGTGSGSRPSSSGMGWTKPALPAAAALPEKNRIAAEASGLDVSDAARVIGSYLPPSARSSGAGAMGPVNADRDVPPVVDKVVLLRGEDFPSLQAVRPVSAGASQKQKDGLNQKQKQVLREGVGSDKEGGYHLGPLVDTGQSPSDTIGNRLAGNGGKGLGTGNGQLNDQIQKQEEYIPEPLPLVHVNPRSDWADDERDTGHGFIDHGRDIGCANSESYWDRDFDLPRPSLLPHKPVAQNQYDRWGPRDNDTGKKFPGEVPRVDMYSKDARVPSRDGKEVNKWRNSPRSIDGFSSQELGSYRVEAGSRMAGNNNYIKENKYVPPHYGATSRDGGVVRGKDYPTFGRRESGPVWLQHQQRNTIMESFNNCGPVHNSGHVTESPYRYRGDNLQSNNLSKTSFTSGGKMLHVADPLLNMGRDKRFLNCERSFSGDPFSRDFGPTVFDERDPFSEELVFGVMRRKKDAPKLSDFHDPVRESFEAELERVQKMQELERQRIIEEQEQALEQGRREEEERQRRIKEEEERRRKLEEEAREAAWRAEQEGLEAIRKAEEQRIAREEEKRRMQLEEDRRKQAAKQKLEELEARMAKRQAETSKTDAVVSKTIVDENLKSEVNERHVSRVDMDTWEDSERMVENVVSSGSFDLPSHTIPVEMSSRPYPPREGSSNFVDRGKFNNSWKRDGGLEIGSGFPVPLLNQDTGHYSPRGDPFGSGRGFPRKEFYSGAGYMPSRGYLKAGMPEPYLEEFGYHKDHRWNPSPGNVNPHGKFREMEPEFHDTFAERYGDVGWGQGRPQVNTRPPYPEGLYPHPESNDIYNYGRSRYSVRQPRVLPPPSLVTSQRPDMRVTDQLAGPPSFLDDGIHYPRTARTEPPAYYDSNQGGLEPSEMFGLQHENSTSEDQNLNNASRCDSQSSLSVLSPPISPPHLSLDELDESGDSRATSSLEEGKGSSLTGARPVAADGNPRNDSMLMVSDNFSAVEDEEWAVENENTLQQQEEYDEDEGGYKEEDEVRERGDGNLKLVPNFERLEIEVGESPNAMENVVLGFDDGVEVAIPSDDFEKTLDTQEKKSLEIAENVADIMKESDTGDWFPSDPPNYPPADDSHGNNSDSSTNLLEKAASQGCISQYVTTVASSNITGLAAQQSTSTTADASLSSNNVPSLSSSESQADLSVKLQFGLFSGPSLIPSPVPTIQIGSIQMPLHIHPAVGQSMTTHMHPSQPPLFQFGQLSYTSPIFQGFSPMAPQSMSFIQPNMLGHFNLNQNAGGSVANEPSSNSVNKDEVSNIPINNQPSFNSPSTEQFREVQNVASNTLDRTEDDSEKIKSSSGPLTEEKVQANAALKIYLSSSKAKAKASGVEAQHAPSTTQSVIAADRNHGGMRVPGGRGRRFSYAVKYMRVSVQDHGMPSDSNVFQIRPRRTVQRTEFRVRENNDRRPPPVSSNNVGLDYKSNCNGKAVEVFARSGSKRGTVSNRTMKPRIESESLGSGSVTPQEVSGGAAKVMEKDKGGQSASHPVEGNLMRYASEDDVDAPLQSGVVCVFKQPGIEAPSDEDDFIEVRSKRQMLNDRREQREKEIKAKSRTTKPTRKPRASRPNYAVLSNHNKPSIALRSQEAMSPQLEFTSSESPNFADNESTGYTTAASQPPIGTSPINTEAQASKSAQAGQVPVVSDGRTELESGLNIDKTNKVMSLSQPHIDAKKPAQYDSLVYTVGSHCGAVSDPVMPTSSILTKDKAFSSGSSPISSLLAGEKIQFGAVTSPTVLPPTTRATCRMIGAPGSNRPDVQKSSSFPLSEKNDSLFFSKEKLLTENVQDCEAEAEAEAAASAVAVAAISSDEIVGNGNDTKSFTACVNDITKGAAGDMHATSPSQSEEPLSVSLPADLSVETTPISLWPPMPSPQSSSGQMLSHFPTGPPTHIPFYEMNPLLGAPIFAFSPHEESSGNQSQPPKSMAQASGHPLGNWHSGMDSFYGAPAGYPPFIGPHGGIPGVQGPTPHMVVYNHFAPVGQYGQVGLSFMGATYIPSGKQGDRKNNAASSSVHSSVEGGIDNVNVSNVQRGGPNMTSPIKHLPPGSPLLPMPTPMPMFDVSPFQTAPDLPVQARWNHIPHSSILPVSRPPQFSIEAQLPSQVNNPGNPTDQSQATNRFIETRTPTESSNKSLSFNISSESIVSPFLSQIELSAPQRSGPPASGSCAAAQTLPSSSNSESIKTDTAENSKPLNTSALKAQFSKKNLSSAEQGNNIYNYNNNNTNTSRYGYQRGEGMRHSSGSEYSHRRMCYRGRHQLGGGEKCFHTSKVKQIYVAKQTSCAGPTA